MGERWSAFASRGRDGQMSPDEIDAYLQEPTLCRLACLDDDGWPYVVPVWFEWTGDGFWVIPRKRSAWARYLQARPQVAMTIDADDGRRVLCQGTARLVEEPNVGGQWVEIARRMAHRYRGEAGEAYLEATLEQPRWLFLVEPRRLITWNRPGWHAKYAE